MGAQLRPWLDGRIPSAQGPGSLLSVGRSDVEVTFVERVGDGSGRVYYPADSQNEVVAPLAEGVYSTGAVCPAVLGADGRVAMVYPPLDLIEEGEDLDLDSLIPVGDWAEQLIVESHVLDNHTEVLGEVEAQVEDTKDRLAVTDYIVDGLTVDVPRLEVDIRGAVEAAISAGERADAAQSTADSAGTKAAKAEQDAATAQTAAEAAQADAATKADAAELAAKTYAAAQAAAAEAAARAAASNDATEKAAAAQAAAEAAAALDAKTKADAAQQAAEQKAATAQAAADAAMARAKKAEQDAANALSIANISVAQLADALAEEPPADPVEGAVWFPRNEEGQVTGVWQYNGEAWGTHATLTGMLIVPAEDGSQTIISQDGVDTTDLLAETIRTPLLYADVAGVKTLVVTDIPRANLDQSSQDSLESADLVGSRILIDGADGSITIALETRGGEARVTYTRLTATRMTFVVEDKVKAYIDGPKSQLYAENALVEDTLIVGAHQVKTIPGSGITTWQHVGGR